MYELLAIAFVVTMIVVYRQGQKLKRLESEVVKLSREMLSRPVSPAIEETVQAQAEPAVEPLTQPEAAWTPEPDPDAEEEDAETVGPWAQAARAASERAETSELPYVLPTKAAGNADIETALGTRWAVWVGGIALALGGIFLVRYSIEAGIFGPGVRLIFAAVFGVALAGAGEIARRRGFASPIGGIDSAYIPSILTAAAAFVLFGAIFAAHGIYGFIGPAAAFALLGLVGLATIGVALIHGQALAGLGLLGSYLTPALVASAAPNPWSLFIYLAIVLCASIAIASLRRWRFLSTASYIGAGLWSLLYIVASRDIVPLPVIVLQLAGLAVLGGIWLRGAAEGDEGRTDAPSVASGIFAGLVAFFTAVGVVASIGIGQVSVVGAVPLWSFLLFVAMLATAAWRRPATPLLHAAGTALVLSQICDIATGSYVVELWGGSFSFDGAWLGFGNAFFIYAVALAVLFLVGGLLMARQIVGSQRYRAAMWSFWAAAVPFAVLFTVWLTSGNLDIDWRYAGIGLVLALALAAGGEATARAETPPLRGGWAVSFSLAGAALSLAYVLLAGFGPVWTTVLTGLAAALPAAVTRFRSYRALGWLSAGFAAIVLVRVAFEPTIAGWDRLGTTPVFNALLPGYLLPALAFAYAAWQLQRTTGGRPRLIMETLAALFTLLGVAMLVRHAMNGGVIDAGEPFLAEQSIYTLIMIGAGGILLALDVRSPSPVFRYGSMIAGVLSVFTIATTHFIDLNPLATNDSTGTIPVINLILLGYLLPAIAMAAVALYARGKRPGWYVSMLAVGAAALAFAYVSLSVRRIFQGEFIGAWKGMTGLENYTYSAVWLALGVAILVAGVRLRSRVLRLASAGLVVIAVAKVFVFDMSGLEGVLRALSFMGLGVVLIGIGMFYQRMLVSEAAKEVATPPAEA
ncbi:DUF2339 domain-containing protein [Mesorhizobium sp. CAU 1732]|uniref:DUF2339 domain-containing protein n=1 Tax=Mesorhizobium sp. CAU 1732 TaxID=3140358 RepID=UPI00326149C8